MTRRLHLAPLLPVSATLLALLRYWQQSDSNVWTKLDLHLYVEDPDLGWRQLDEGVPWLGLDSIALLLLFSLCVFIGARLVAKRSARLQSALWVFAALSLLLPSWAFLGGSPRAGARPTRPVQQSATEMQEVQAHLPGLPAGRYELLDHKDTGIVASLVAGGETFDARWPLLRGAIQWTPARLDSAIEAHFTTEASSVDSDLGERDKHIREYLQSERHPEIGLRFGQGIATRSEASGGLRFRAPASLELMGVAHPVEVSGHLTRPDAEAQARLGVSEEHLLLLIADFKLDLATTPIEDPEELFDSLEANIHVTLLLHNQPTASP